MTDFDQARNLFLTGLDHFDRDDFANAEQHFRAALQILPQNSAILTNLSAVLFRQNKLPEALELAKRALAANAADIQALSIVERCHFQAGRFTQALAACDSII